MKDLKVFASFNEDLFKEITQLLTLDNFRYYILTFEVWCMLSSFVDDWLKIFCCVPRQNEQLSKYGDTKSARNIMLVELKKLIEANPLFRDKLTFPSFKASRLRTLINQRCYANVNFMSFILSAEVLHLGIFICFLYFLFVCERSLEWSFVPSILLKLPQIESAN